MVEVRECCRISYWNCSIEFERQFFILVVKKRLEFVENIFQNITPFFTLLYRFLLEVGGGQNSMVILKKVLNYCLNIFVNVEYIFLHQHIPTYKESTKLLFKYIFKYFSSTNRHVLTIIVKVLNYYLNIS